MIGPAQIQVANIESSPLWNTSCLSELIYDLINRQFLRGKCPRTVTIQYLLTVDMSARWRRSDIS